MRRRRPPRARTHSVSLTPRTPRFRLSAFYALYFGVLGVLIPFWPLFLQAKGFEPRAIGAFMAILPATKIVAPSFWGWLSDRSGHPLRFIRWTSFLSVATMALLIPDTPDPQWIAGAMIGFGLFWNGPQPLLETVTLAYLKGRKGYGRVRLWGSIGYIMSVALGGLLLGEVLPLNRLPQLLTALLGLQWLVTLLIPDITTRGDSLGGDSLSNILKRPQVLGFLMAALLIQLAHGPYYSFYSVFLSSHGFNDEIIGALWGLGVLSEVLLFIWMDRLEGRFGLANLFLWGIVISVIRWAIIGWGVDVPALVVLAQVLHAGTFGLMHVASIALVHQHFKGGHHAKGQAIYSGFCYGVGGAAGSLYAGYLWQAVPASWVFLSASLMSLLAIGFAWPLIRDWRAVRG